MDADYDLLPWIHLTATAQVRKEDGRYSKSELTAAGQLITNGTLAASSLGVTFTRGHMLRGVGLTFGKLNESYLCVFCVTGFFLTVGGFSDANLIAASVCCPAVG